MPLPIRLPKNWFQLLTAVVMVGSMLQNSTSVLAKKTASIQINNQASYTYKDSVNGQLIQGTSSQIINTVQQLVDPLGQITGCAGEVLPDYTGFKVGLYEVNSSDLTGTALKGLVPLTRTRSPDLSGKNLPIGLAPNIENTNPFFLTNGEQGKYNFLLDPNRSQLDPGRAYILLIQPPNGSIYDQRRVRIVFNARNGDFVSYTATSLDGKPLTATDDSTSISDTINIKDAERIGLNFAVLDMNTSVCQAQEIQIIKTGDRAAAEPGDTVIYHLSVKNLANSPVNNVVVTDTLPLGFNFRSGSVRTELGGTSVPITTSRNGSTITLRADGVTLPPSSTNSSSVLNIAYAAVLTPDAVRGSGQNSAIVQGKRADNNRPVKDGPATYRLRLQPGILSDCGTLIGRVFVDKNFDGEQQPGEPGLPNAVILLDDGNRITTDANGLFSVANVISGYRTGVLDLSSVPGYKLARNHKFKERNSQSRLVHLEPSGLARMNFAVTPVKQANRQ